MHFKPTLLLFLTVLSFTACKSDSGSSTPVNHALPASDAQPPLLLTLHGPTDPKPGAVLELVIQVQRTSLAYSPMVMNIHLPPSVRLVEGSDVESIYDSTSYDIKRIYTIAVEDLPTQDLTVTLDVLGERHGVHAVAAYRFGRPEPRLEQPNINGPHAVLGGVDMGPSIPLQTKR